MKIVNLGLDFGCVQIQALLPSKLRGLSGQRGPCPLSTEDLKKMDGFFDGQAFSFTPTCTPVYVLLLNNWDRAKQKQWKSKLTKYEHINIINIIN